MDEFTESLIEDTVPAVMQLLGVPRPLAELAVRHAYYCTEDRCPVYHFLLKKANALTSELTGVPVETVTEVEAQHTKAAADTLNLQRKLGLPTGFEERRAAYDNIGPALDLTMDILMEKP